MSDRSFVFGVDLDGVVADFYGGLRPIAAEWLGVIIDTLPQRVSWGLTEWGVDEAPGGYERLHRFAVTQRELFSRVPPMPGAPQALRRLSIEGVRIRIITHRLFIKYFHQVAVSQTIEWLDRHDIPYWDLCLCSKKRRSAPIYTSKIRPRTSNACAPKVRKRSSLQIPRTSISRGREPTPGRK